MEDASKARSRNITIGIVAAVLMLAIFPCIIAAMVAFGVAAYYSLSTDSTPPVEPPAPQVEPAPVSKPPDYNR